MPFLLVSFHLKSVTRFLLLMATLSAGVVANELQMVDTAISVESVEPLLSADKAAEFVTVPLIFSTETLSTAFGGAGVVKHAGQAQAAALGIGLYTSNDSWVTYLGLFNYQIPTWQQWLFSAEGYQAHYQEGIYYVPVEDLVNPGVEDTDRVISVGDEAFYRLHMKYVLPIGHGAQGAARSLIPVKDNISWNPMVSGITSVRLTPFLRRQTLELYDDLPDSTQGFELLFNWDNRDNGNGSHLGGQTSFTLSRDFGSGTRSSWTTWEFEQSAFVPLGDNSWFHQQVLAFNFYLADTPTWDSQNSDGTYHRPPSFAGVSLGGFERLRGYSSRQFAGRSAVDYALEYRVQPHWQPLQNWPVFNLYQVPWWEWVVFAEAGKVTQNFDLNELHQEMKWIYGVAARFEIEQVVVRTEFAFGGDESQVWVMVNQPF